MRTSNGQNVCPKCKSVIPSDDTRNVSKKIKKRLYPAQVALLDFIHLYDALQLIQSLEWLHTTTLYHSNECIEAEEKSMLYTVKVLMEKLEDIAQEA